MTIPELEQKAFEIRQSILRLAKETGHGHIAPALSCVEILVALYYEVMGPDDVFVMSKGHGALGLYAILLDLGKSPSEGARTTGCLEHLPPHIRGTTGSLGHGLPLSVGIALAKKLRGAPGRVYCLVGDAELQEGSCEEAFGLIQSLNLDNIVAIVDVNGFGAMQEIRDFNSTQWWIPTEGDGHDLKVIIEGLKENVCSDVLSLTTTKGKGVPFMEGKPEWHFRHPSTPEELSWIDSFLSSGTTTDASSST